MFDYPLTREEITKYLSQKASQKQVETILKTQINKIQSKKRFYYLKNRSDIVATRVSREQFSKQKLNRALKFNIILKLIPSVKLIAITGALAVGNSTKNDDIDFMIISSKKTLWTTRMLANLLLWPWKRTPNSRVQSGKACLNIFLDERDLKIKDQNLYTAHEIAQIRVIYDKENTYIRFIKENKWLQKYLPNWQPEHILNVQSSKTKNSMQAYSAMMLNPLLNKIEMISKQSQLAYMKSKQTTEQIGDTQLFFHPKNIQRNILEVYKKKIKSIKV